jgi:hypothetical protein
MQALHDQGGSFARLDETFPETFKDDDEAGSGDDAGSTERRLIMTRLAPSDPSGFVPVPFQRMFPPSQEHFPILNIRSPDGKGHLSAFSQSFC